MCGLPYDYNPASCRELTDELTQAIRSFSRCLFLLAIASPTCVLFPGEARAENRSAQCFTLETIFGPDF